MAEDFIGRKFNMLTVIERSENYISPQGKPCSRWKCVCDCGNVTVATRGELTSGHKKSCGCLKHKGYSLIDLTGKRFGRLTVLERSDNQYNQTSWKCICDCGNTIITTSQRLRNGECKSCGCYARDFCIQKNKKYNRYEFLDSYIIGYDCDDNDFKIDLEDYDKIKDYYWTINSNGYIHAWNSKTKSWLLLHRIIMNCPEDNVVDHIGGQDTIRDNRKINLRLATLSQNQMNSKLNKNNTSGCTGVTFEKRSQKWISQIQYNNKRYYLGSYENKDDAIKARKEGEKLYFKQYSYDNSQALHQKNKKGFE